MPPVLPDHRSRVGLLLPRVPQHYDSIRNRPHGLLDRLRHGIISRLRPISQHDAVRGLAIATENLLQCLLLRDSVSPFDYHLFGGMAPALYRQWLNAKSLAPASRFQVSSIGSLARSASLHGIGMWYEPQANYNVVYQLRDRLAEIPYPIVSTVHGISIHSMLFKHFTRVLLCDTYPTDSFVCTSSASKRALQNILGSLADTLNKRYGIKRQFVGRYDVIPLPVDTDAFRPGEKPAVKRKLELPPGCTFLLYLGLVSTLKADLFPCLLALSECGSDFDRHDIIFGVAGGADDAYLTSLVRYAHAVGFPHSRLRIFKDPPDDIKHNLLRAADIFTSPADSVQEAFGLAVVEAMACGVPQVVANWNGYRDTVQDGITGFLVPTLWTRCDEELSHTGFLLGWTYDHHLLGQSVAMDIEYWRRAVLTLVNNVELRNQMAVASRQRATLYSMESVRRQYFDLWSDLLSRPMSTSAHFKCQHIETPRYYDWFQHLASNPVTPATVLEAVRHPQRLVIMESTNAIKECVRKDVLHSVFRVADAGDRVTVEDVVTSLVGKVDSTTVLWHIMWALKHGLLRSESKLTPSARGKLMPGGP
jgi:D-inositol-3-phosphate glycosyltransferase